MTVDFNPGFNFALTLLLAAAGPVVALRYLEPILLKLLRSQCPEGGEGADFWMRSAYVLAVCGTVLLALSFGQYRGEAFDAVERALWLVAAGTFITVAFVTRQVWAPVRLAQTERRLHAQRELLRTQRANRQAELDLANLQAHSPSAGA